MASRFRRSQNMFLTFLLAVLAPSAMADCIDYAEYIDLMGAWSIGGEVWDIEVHGELAFVCSNELTILDITDPATPEVVAELEIPGITRGIAFSGDYAFVSGYYTGLHVVDLSDIQTPLIVASIEETGRYPEGVAVVGQYLYMTVGGWGLQAVDISDPTVPVVVDEIELPGTARGVVVEGGHAYVCAHHGGFHVVDVSDPTDMQLRGTADLRYTTHARIRGDYAFVAVHNETTYGAIWVVDISTPTQPTPVAAVTSLYQAVDLVLVDDLAYVSSGSAGLQIVDIADPLHPVHVGGRALDEYVLSVAVGSDHIWLGNDSGTLYCVDARPYSAPEPAGSWGADLYLEAGDLLLAGELAYVGGDDGVFILDLTRPDEPSLLSMAPVYSSAMDLAVVADRLYTVDFIEGLHIFDVWNPEAPELIGALDPNVVSWALAVAENEVYVGTAGDGLMIVNAEQPEALTVTDVILFPEYIQDIIISDGLLYMSCSGDGVAVVEVAAGQGEIIGQLTLPGWSRGMALSGDILYVAASQAGLLLVDVSEPSTPALIASVKLPGDALHVEVAAPYAYVSCGPVGVQIVDISMPSDLQRIGSIDVGRLGSANQVRCTEDFAYIAAYHEGVQILPLQCDAPSGVEDEPSVPENRELLLPALSVFPNPFNATAIIEFSHDRPLIAKVAVYDVAGRQVRSLFTGWIMNPTSTFVWNGRTDGGETVASGTYVVRLESRSLVRTARLTLCK